MIKVLLFGSEKYPYSIFGKVIAENDFEVVGIVTSKDSIYEMESEKSKYNEIKVFITDNINKEGKNILEETKPDLILVCNYGQFLDKDILDYPKYKCLNIHFSLLPRLRGACPVEAAILKDVKKTGVSIQLMEEDMDTGDLIYQEEVDISKDETSKSLLKKLQNITVKNINRVLKRWIKKKVKPWPQKGKATYCYRNLRSKSNARIDWSKTSDEIEREIRAFNPKPISWTYILTNSKKLRLKIFKAEVGKKIDKEILKEEGKLYIRTKDRSIVPLIVQLEGKKKMNISNFLNGFKDKFIIK